MAAARQQDWTPLHAAAESGDVEVRPSDETVIATNDGDKTAVTLGSSDPMVSAASQEIGNDLPVLQVAEKLVAAGASTDATTSVGRTPLHTAAYHGHAKVRVLGLRPTVHGMAAVQGKADLLVRCNESVASWWQQSMGSIIPIRPGVSCRW